MAHGDIVGVVVSARPFASATWIRFVLLKIHGVRCHMCKEDFPVFAGTPIVSCNYNTGSDWTS